MERSSLIPSYLLYHRHLEGGGYGARYLCGIGKCFADYEYAIGGIEKQPPYSPHKINGRGLITSPVRHNCKRIGSGAPNPLYPLTVNVGEFTFADDMAYDMRMLGDIHEHFLTCTLRHLV